MPGYRWGHRCRRRGLPRLGGLGWHMPGALVLRALVLVATTNHTASGDQ